MKVLRALAFVRPSAVAFCLAAALAVWSGPVTGRAQSADAKVCALGATRAEISKLYGPVLRHNARVRHHEILDGGDSVFTGDLYGKHDLIIRAVFNRERCVLLEYTRINAALGAADVDAALAASVSGFAWETGKDSTDASKYYHRTDGKAIAQWATGYDGSLLVSAEDGDTGFGRDIGH